MLTLALLAASPLQAAAAPTEGTTALELCGTLNEHRAATATGAGSLTVGTRTLTVGPGVVAGNGGVEVAVGRDLCVTASAARISGELVRYLFFPFPPDGQLCGNVISTSAGGVIISADFGALSLALGPVLTPPAGRGVCYAVEVARPSGDLIAVRSQPVDTNNEREWIHHCGTVKQYTSATAQTSGLIGVGSSSWRIASGTSYTGDPAGDRTDRTAVGSNMCLRATLGDGGEIIEYLTGAMPSQVGGAAAAYTPPTGDRPGQAVLSYRSQYRLKIPPAIDAVADLARDSHCYAIGVDASGDAIATALLPCGQGGVAAGPGATGSPAVVTASPTPTPTALVLPSPPPEVGSRTPVDGSNALLGIAAAVGAVAVVALFFAWRRGLRP